MSEPAKSAHSRSGDPHSGHPRQIAAGLSIPVGLLMLALVLMAALALALPRYPALSPGWLAVPALIGAAAVLDLVRRRQVLMLTLHLLEVQLTWLARHGTTPLPRPLAARRGDMPLSNLLLDCRDAALQARTAAADRLRRAIGAVPEPVLMVNLNGRVLLVNEAARRVFGGAALAAGSSLFDVFRRDQLGPAIDAAGEGEPVAIDAATLAGDDLRLWLALLDADTVLLTLQPSHAPELLALHTDSGGMAALPAAEPATAVTPLNTLDLLVLDVETTGLDPQQDQVVSVGAVRMRGQRIFIEAPLDLLIAPGRPISAASTAIHGISDAMVADAPGFAEAMPETLALLSRTVLAGYNIGFDAAILKAEAARHGLPWPDPPLLDARLLAAALGYRDEGMEALARALSVDPRGRHTALGDSLVSADLLAALLREAAATKGIATWADLLVLQTAHTAQVGQMLAQMRAAGWLVPQPIGKEDGR